jgi:hypothetical protein
MGGVLKLRGEDAEDLKVISAYLQDSIVPLADMSWLPAERSFVMLLNRFKWEDVVEEDVGNGADRAEPDADGDAPFLEGGLLSRTHCGVRFDGVSAVRSRGIDRHDRQRLLSLLCITCGEGALLMHFSGGGCIRLEVGKWVCHVEDIGEPWPTGRRPAHVLSNDVLDNDAPDGGPAKDRAAG